MEIFRVFLFCLVFGLQIQVSISQLSSTENRILFQVQEFLEFPEVFQGWNNWTNFCYLPPSSSLKIVCSGDRVTELTVAGNRTSPLSKQFSIDAFFTVLTKLSSLRILSLVSLGLWGPLPLKISRFSSIEVLNFSSNFINGEIPRSVSSFKNLTTLVLTDNLLNGSIPDLQNLVFLQELNLGSNHLGPKFPKIAKNLSIIVLRHNSLRSEIPLGLKKFTQLQEFDVSYNKFLGSIPSFLFSLPSLEYLNVAENQLTGVLPVNLSCSSKLKLLDISHNLLTGKLPICIGLNASNRTVNSSWNCFSSGDLKLQHPNSFCQKQALAVQPPSKTQKQENSFKLGLLLGIIGGVFAIGGVVGLLIFAIFRRSEARQDEDYMFEGSVSAKMSVERSPKAAMDTRRVPQTLMVAAIGIPPYNVFTLEEIEDATNNFDPMNLVGEGSQGQVYKGWLRDGSMVLVKCLKLKQKHLLQNLKQQIEVISKLRHRNLVSVLGHCIVTYQNHPGTASTVFIVMEYVSNGSLRDYLTDWRKKEMLKWPQRMAISIGVARGVQFLHRGVAPGIFGNNLKMDNILLDDTLTAKLTNYNLPLSSKVGSESPLNGQDVSNNVGSDENGEKEDIYQLGLVLLEVITGKVVTSVRELDEVKLQLERSLTETAMKLRSAIDPSIRGTFAYQSVRTAVEITINCLSKDSSMRPSIEDVLWNLQYSIQVQEGWTSSENLGTKM